MSNTTIEENKLILQPKDYIVLHFGLKIENVGDKVIELEMPNKVTIYPVNHVQIAEEL